MKKLGALLLVGSVLLLSGCGQPEATTLEAEQSTNTQPIAVTVQKVKTGDMANTNTFSGRTKVGNETAVTAEMAGAIEKVYVSVGQKVQKGDTLLTIKGTDLQKNIEQAQVSLEIAQTSYENAIGPNVASQKNQLENAVTQAQMNYDEAKRNYDTYQELYEADAISQDQFAKFELSLKQSEHALNVAKQSYETTINETMPASQALAKKQVDQAQIAYDNAVSNKQKLVIKAPVSGTVTTVNFDEGEMVSQGGPAFIISNTNTLEVQIQVTENDLKQFKVGEKVAVKVGGESVTGTIKLVSTVTDPKTDLYTVTLSIANQEGKFFAGMSAEIELTLAKSEDTIIIPKKAVFIEEGKPYVYVCRDNKATKVAIERGLENIDTVAVKSGLNAEDILVIGGISLIGDGVDIYPVLKED